MKKQQPWIGVLDCNNFFVSCERLFRPDLQNKPVVVLSSNDGCVVARSQEVKDIGVPMGVPYFQVKDILQKHGTTTFSSHFALYRDLSRRVFEVVRDKLDTIEQYSVDEAFFTLFDTPAEGVWEVKRVVEQRVGIPVSIGVARTKTQAKYASTLAKKGGGVTVLSPAAWRELTPDIHLSEIWGVGGKLARQYKAHKLNTVADLLAVPTDRAEQLFGVVGVRLQQELLGQPVFPVTTQHPKQKSIMSSRSFCKKTTDFAVLADAVAYHVRHAAADLRAMGLQAQVVRVSIRPSSHGDFILRGGSKEAVLVAPSNDSIELLRVAQELCTTLYEPGVPYQKAGVVLSGLRESSCQQASLFTEEAPIVSTVLWQVVDAINQRTKQETIQIGTRLRTESWASRHAARSPAYTTRWADVPKAFAK